MSLYERFFEDLTPREQQVIAAIKRPEDIKEVELLDTWSDDHIMCAGVRINGVEMGFWWIGPDAGAFNYPDSPKARMKILEIITNTVAENENPVEEIKQEFLTVSEDTEISVNGKRVLLEKGDRIQLL